MTLVLLVLAVSVMLGWLAGGSIGRLGRLPLRSGWLVLVAVGVQLAGALIGGYAFAVGLLLSAAVVGLFLGRNRGVRGTGLVALGLLANGLVVLLNGAMPVSVRAAERAGADLAVIARGDDARHELADSGTRLGWLGDVFPLRLPSRPEVVSTGDVLVAAGIGQLVVLGMGGAPPRLTGRPTGRARPHLPPSR